ncbi:hypothetical protein D3C78_1348280 [compost metagenome]
MNQSPRRFDGVPSSPKRAVFTQSLPTSSRIDVAGLSACPLRHRMRGREAVSRSLRKSVMSLRLDTSVTAKSSLPSRMPDSNVVDGPLATCTLTAGCWSRNCAMH